MKNAENTLFCRFCQEQVTFHQNIVNHRKELIRTICTFGFWLPFWLCMSSKSKICDVCGNVILKDSE
jgi:hypothetical protein